MLRTWRMKQFAIAAWLVVSSLCVTPLTSLAAAASPGDTALEKAAQANKYLFIFFNTDQDQQTAAMQGVFQAAMTKMKDRADGIAIQVMDPAEKGIVEKFGVRGAPMPLVLAIAPTGAATKAFTKNFDESQLEQAFVGPAMAKCMRVIQDHRMILVCVQNGKTQLNKEALAGVQAFKAGSTYANATEVVMLNPADPAEQNSLKELQVDPQINTAITLLVVPPGSLVGRFPGAVTKEQIEAGIKQASSGCGPGCSCHH